MRGVPVLLSSLYDNQLDIIFNGNYFEIKYGKQTSGAILRNQNYIFSKNTTLHAKVNSLVVPSRGANILASKILAPNIMGLAQMIRRHLHQTSP